MPAGDVDFGGGQGAAARLGARHGLPGFGFSVPLSPAPRWGRRAAFGEPVVDHQVDRGVRGSAESDGRVVGAASSPAAPAAPGAGLDVDRTGRIAILV